MVHTKAALGPAIYYLMRKSEASRKYYVTQQTKLLQHSANKIYLWKSCILLTQHKILSLKFEIHNDHDTG